MGSIFNDLLILWMINCAPAASYGVRWQFGVGARLLWYVGVTVPRENLQQAEVPAIKMLYKGDQKK